MSGSHQRSRAVARWLPAVTWMAVIFALSSISGLRVSQDADVDRPLRVLAHVSSYALLAGLLLFAKVGPNRPRRSDVVFAFLLAVAYGLTDEVHQANVPHRSGRVEDLVVDALGAAAGLALAWFVLGRRSRAHGSTEGEQAA